MYSPTCGEHERSGRSECTGAWCVIGWPRSDSHRRRKEEDINRSVFNLRNALDATFRLLELTEDGASAIGNQLLRESVVAMVCDCFSALPEAAIGSEHFRDCLDSLAGVLSWCDSSIHTAIIQIDRENPFMCDFIARCASFLSGLVAFRV